LEIRSSVAVIRAATLGDCRPGILATPPGRQQHAEIAELVGGLRDLAEIIEIDLAPAGRGAEIAAIAVGRKKPQDVGLGRLLDTH
jgi:hypothetical protein